MEITMLENTKGTVIKVVGVGGAGGVGGGQPERIWRADGIGGGQTGGGGGAGGRRQPGGRGRRAGIAAGRPSGGRINGRHAAR